MAIEITYTLLTAAVVGVGGFLAGRGNYPKRIDGMQEALDSCTKEKELMFADKVTVLEKLHKAEEELNKLPKRENGKFVPRAVKLKAKP